MKIKLLTFASLSILTISQLSFINSKNDFFSNKIIENPYIPYSDDSSTYWNKSIDIVEDNNNKYHSGTNGTGISYVQVIDNSTNDYFNYVTNLGPNQSMIDFQTYNSTTGGYYTNKAYFYPSLSNIKRNETYYMSFPDEAGTQTINKFSGDEYAIVDPTTDLNSEQIKWEEVNNSTINDKSRMNHYEPTTVYPYISSYNDTTSDVFQMNNLIENNRVTFTIKVNNWEEGTETPYLTEENEIGVTLINESESDEYLKYEQYDATLISDDNGYYTYEINGLTPDTNYTFYSINFTGLTIDDQSYFPDFDIKLVDELFIPEEMTRIYAQPYVDTLATDVFTIDKIEAKSIEFSLKVIDTTDQKYLNYLNTEDNTMDVKLVKGNSTVPMETEATFVSENNGYFKFKIEHLDSKTNYEIYSLDNTGLMVNGIVDNEILIEDELHVQNEEYFITGSNLAFYLITGISILLVILGIAIVSLYFIKNTKNTKEIEAAISDTLEE